MPARNMPLVGNPFAAEETALLNTCYANLADDAPWLVYSDWLRDHGNKRADRVMALRETLIRLLPVAMHVEEAEQRFMPRALLIAEFAPDD